MTPNRIRKLKRWDVATLRPDPTTRRRHSRRAQRHIRWRRYPAYFSTFLGFEFDPRFTDSQAACMIVNDRAHAILLTEPFFKTLTKRQICDRQSHTENIVALSCGSRDEVDELTTKAIAAGAARAMDPVDLGFVYRSSFYDLDGHHWEVIWIAAQAIPNSRKQTSASRRTFT
jgi:predicted lactoylglutathione lyase